MILDADDERRFSWIEDFRGCRATLSIALAWVVVYLAMSAYQGRLVLSGNLLNGGITPATGHDFGDATPREILKGQLWRTLTATFVHFGLLHLGLNLLALWQVGRMVEKWYGSAWFLAFYAVVGGLGNLVAAASKVWTSSPEANGPSGGGSGVLCGLVATAAVVGLRSRTRVGSALGGWMLATLVSTAALGLLGVRVDNAAHAAGAVLGAIVGLLDRAIIRAAGSVLARSSGVVAIGALLASGLAQAAYAEAEHRLVADLRILGAVEAMNRWARDEMISRATPVDRLARARRRRVLLGLVDLSSRELAPRDLGPDAPAARRMLSLASEIARARPTPGAILAYERSEARVSAHLRAEIADRTRRLAWLRGIDPTPTPTRGPRP